MIAVINYSKESSESLKRIFDGMDITDEIKFTDCEDVICSSDKIILPDTANIKLTLRWMQFHNFYNLFRMLNKPILGISTGAAMMCESISEINGLCLSFFPVAARCLQTGTDDHIQSRIEINSQTKLLSNIDSKKQYYFNNRCNIAVNDFTSSKVKIEGKELTATIEKSDYYGILFDPLQSREEGKKVINNFLML